VRRYFGTDGVRGVVGEDLTVELVEQLGKAASLWSGRGRVFVGRDTRASGEELEEAFARGVMAAGGHAVLAGVLPTPAVALLALDFGIVITASHNPPEYNGVKFFDADGQKLTDAAEEEIEALLEADARGGGGVDRVGVATESYLEHVLERFGSELNGLRVVVDCANGAYSGTAPKAFTRLGADVTTIGDEPDGRNINVGCGATDLALLSRAVVERGAQLGIAFDGDGDRMLAVDAAGETVDGDQILAILALDLGVETVAVTQMTNLGFHRLMDEHGIRVVTTAVGDRYVLEALRAIRPCDLPARPRHGRRARRRAAALRRPERPHFGRGCVRDAQVAAGEGERPCAGEGLPRDAAHGASAHQRGARRIGTCTRPPFGHGTGRTGARGGRK
jgi:phosphoglucosamine mutase